MLNITKVLQSDRLLRAITGLNRKAFDELKYTFAKVVPQQPIPRRSSKPRQRKQGAGRKPRLETIEQKLIYILFYFKCYPTFDLAGLLFDLDRSQANRWMHRLQKPLEIALGEKMALPKRKLTCMEEFIEAFPQLKTIILDGTHRQIQRAKDQQKQKQNYSGKKKLQTKNHLCGVSPSKRILLLSEAYEGRRHDKGILNEEQWGQYIPEEIEIQGDLGFQGLQKERANVRIPHKKAKGGELTNEQKEENRELASERVVCEHGFAGVKRYNIVSGVYRNKKEGFDDESMLISAGLWNYYLMAA